MRQQEGGGGTALGQGPGAAWPLPNDDGLVEQGRQAERQAQQGAEGQQLARAQGHAQEEERAGQRGARGDEQAQQLGAAEWRQQQRQQSLRNVERGAQQQQQQQSLQNVEQGQAQQAAAAAGPGSLDQYHVVCSDGGGPYTQWQVRVHFYWYKKVKAAATHGAMGGFTRLLSA